MTDSTYKSSPFRIEEIDELYNNVQKFRSTKYTSKLFEFIANFPKIAPYNAMLVFMQKPGSSYVATAKEWKEKYGRSPKSTANPLIILKTFGPIEFVFEANDTEGKPLPQEITNPFRTEGEISRKPYATFFNNVIKEGIVVKKQNYGTGMAGKIQRLQSSSSIILPEGKKEIEVSHCFYIVINESMSETEEAATVFHELGHYFCGHFRMPDKIKHIPRRMVETLTDQVREFEAETVCWLVCKRLGIINPSEKYLKHYLENNNEVPEGISFDAILKACGKIENMLLGKYKTPKELIINVYK